MSEGQQTPFNLEADMEEIPDKLRTTQKKMSGGLTDNYNLSGVAPEIAKESGDSSLHGSQLVRLAVEVLKPNQLDSSRGKSAMRVVRGNKGRINAVEQDCRTIRLSNASLTRGDALEAYSTWLPPTCIISDGPYGLGKFPGEPQSPDGLRDWYAPHAAEWARLSQPFTTLWFWNSEIGWAKAHEALEMHGWQYEETIIWNKGIAHIAGNVNSKTIRGVPVVTEVAVRYTRKAALKTEDGRELDLKQWLRHEWQRSGLPLASSNAACGVANAATRKYLTQCHLWYFPPGDAVVKMARWCSKYGKPSKKPYFSLDGTNAVTAEAWDRLRAKWTHVHGRTNVWTELPVHGRERVKIGLTTGYLHANQKPISLMERQIAACTDANDVVWEPFGGLCSATVAAVNLGRTAHAAEVNQTYFEAAVDRVKKAIKEQNTPLKYRVA